MIRLAAILLAGVLAFRAASARDAAALKADLESMLPAGKTSIKCAWIKGGNWTEFAAGASNTVVYGVSSEDGAIKRIYPATGSGSYHSVNITADGKRVVFYNANAGNVVVANWDGSGAKNVNVGGYGCEYWRNPNDGSDWSVVEGGAMMRVNIDAPSQKVNINSWACGEDGAGLSDDGTLFYGFDYNRNPAAFGITTVSSMSFAPGPHGGCQGSLGAGISPLYNHNPSGHTQMCVHEAKNQSKSTLYPVTATVQTFLKQKGLSGTCAGENNEGTRFAQHPNYATFMEGKSKVNPILMRLPDMKFIYIEDNLPCTFCGDMDAVFLPYTGIPSTPVVTPRKSTTPAAVPGGAEESYLPDGRRLTSGSNASKPGGFAQGVIVKRAGSGAAGLQTMLVH